MVYQPRSIFLAAVMCVATGYSQPILDKSSVPQTTSVERPAPLSAETRGDIFMARKMYREAIEAFGEGSPKDAILRNKTGIAYHQLQELDKALKCYQQAVKLNPQYHEAVNNIGTIYYTKKNYRRAISQYRRALKIAPEQASIHSNLGMAYFARNQMEPAVEEFRTALKLDPEVFEHHSSYGVLLQERSVADRAKYHYWMATLYAQGGRTDLALQYLRKAIEEGYKERKKLAEDPAFASMREMPEFKQLLTLEPRVL
ncbi:MAG TPA: tetratricopeptide repeat protein [Verrucomicrobiae bacterium]|nr:tetratricopeptide repeat protein [Verrucomicrobiae bacterium]